MNNATGLKLPKWPFFLGNLIILAFAYFLYTRFRILTGRWEEFLFILSGMVGAVLATLPYLWEYQAAVKMVETGGLLSALDQIKNARDISEKIGAATAQWQNIQEQAAKTGQNSREITDRMAAETAAFTQFLQKANESEKANLRLEVEKLRRSEGEWLQITVRMLDHTYALHQGAVRSGNPNVIEQLNQFQNACRDVARRVGLAPFIPNANEPFDPKIHHSSDAQTVAMTEAKIQDTVATGYLYQGQMIRPALVTLQNANVPTLLPPGAGRGKSETEDFSPVELSNRADTEPRLL